jgi:CRISPR-associated protein Csm1
MAKLFEPKEHGGNKERQCAVCGLEHEKFVVEQVGESEVRKCEPCDSYETLGKKLRNAAFMVLTSRNIPKWEQVSQSLPGTWKEVLHAFGMDAEFFEKDQLPREASQPQVALALKDEALKDLMPIENRAVGRRYLVNVTPLVKGSDLDGYEPEADEKKPEEGEIKPFKMLAEKSKGIERLGVLRMDVDNLGALFESGFDEEATLGRLNAFSAAIGQFFEGQVERLAQQIDGDRLYSIYSGGDDLFFVGAWDAVVELAVAIRRDLDRFSGNNPKIHASAGIVLISNKYPLAQAAQAAGEAEAQAKSLRWQDEKGDVQSKDAVTFLGQSLPWHKFGTGKCDQPGLDDAHALMHELDAMLKADVARGPIYNLLRLYMRYQDALENRQRTQGESISGNQDPQILWGPWMWLGYYYLTKKQNPESLKQLAEKLKETKFNAMTYMGLAARWAMLLNRKQSPSREKGGKE